jgi:hypothetical protein
VIKHQPRDDPPKALIFLDAAQKAKHIYDIKKAVSPDRERK